MRIGLLNTMQKSTSKILFSLLLVSTLVLTSCDLASMNENPNAPTEPTLPFLMTNAQVDLVNQYWGEASLGDFGNLYAQYWSRVQQTEESRYQGLEGTSAGMWESYYLVLSDLKAFATIVRQDPDRARRYGNPQAQIAMAEIMQVYILQVMADIWGPIPLKEALRGRENLSPGYNSQAAIYSALIHSVSSEIQMFPSSDSALQEGDVMFSGNISKWSAFANSLKMRLAIRIADANPDLASQAFTEANSNTTLDEIDENSLIPFESAQPHVNPIYSNNVIEGRTDWAVSEPLMTVMNQWDDPRREAYAQESSNGDYQGFPYGLQSGQAESLWAGSSGNYSLPSERVAYTATSPAILLTASEVLFSKAEAAERGWVNGDPASLYESAIRASMSYWGVDSESDIDAYISQVSYNSSEWRQDIGVQKWIALYMQGVQGWVEFRRLDFNGVFSVPPGDPGTNLFGKQFPVRLDYPDSEARLNGEMWSEAVDDYLGGTDSQGVRVWWDTQPTGAPAQ